MAAFDDEDDEHDNERALERAALREWRESGQRGSLAAVRWKMRSDLGLWG